MTFFTELEQIFLKFIWNYTRPCIVKIILEEQGEEIKAGSITLPDLRQYYKATIIKTACYWHKNRCMDQQTRAESPEINSHTYSQFIFEKGGKNIQWRKYSFFSKLCLENWEATCKKKKLEHSLNTIYSLLNTIHKNKLEME